MKMLLIFRFLIPSANSINYEKLYMSELIVDVNNLPTTHFDIFYRSTLDTQI